MASCPVRSDHGNNVNPSHSAYYINNIANTNGYAVAD